MGVFGLPVPEFSYLPNLGLFEQIRPALNGAIGDINATLFDISVNYLPEFTVRFNHLGTILAYVWEFVGPFRAVFFVAFWIMYLLAVFRLLGWAGMAARSAI
jgi:hypothetical protein